MRLTKKQKLEIVFELLSICADKIDKLFEAETEFEDPFQYIYTALEEMEKEIEETDEFEDFDPSNETIH